MKKVLFLMLMLVVATATKAQDINAVNGNNPTLLQPANGWIYYGSEVMNKKDCVEFLSTRYQPSYETFKSGYKCYSAGWWTLGAGLAVDLAGSLIFAFAPEEGNTAVLYSGMTCLVLGAAGILASIPTIYIGYGRMNKGINMFNMAQAQATTQAYWTIQGSQNGLGLALHF
jgi:hypothetical protein